MKALSSIVRQSDGKIRHLGIKEKNRYVRSIYDILIEATLAIGPIESL